MRFFKLALTLTMCGIAATTYTTVQVVNQSTTYTTAQVVNQSTSSKSKISSSVEKSAAPQYYELRCRGGVTYHSDNTYHIPATQKLDFFITEGRTSTNERMMNMLVNFTAGTQAVDTTGSNLEEGQCSWLDRGFRPGEPTQLRQEIVYFGQLKQLQGKTPIDNSTSAAERYPDSMNLPEYLKDPNHYWSFLVRIMHNGGMYGGDIFEAVSSRYWKPPRIDQEIRTPRSKVPAEVRKPTQ